MPFVVVRNDITSMHADAIVNTANPEPVIGGGTDRAVYEAAGPVRLLAARKKIGQIGRGEAAITPAFNLHARYIIHTVGPKWQGGKQGEEYLLRACYRNSLKLAEEYHCRSIAFPLISTGVYGFPKSLALSIVNEEVGRFLDESDDDMLIYLVVFDEESAALSSDLYDDLAAYIDDHYAAEKAAEEYADDERTGIWKGLFSRRRSGRPADSSGKTSGKSNSTAGRGSGRPLFSKETYRENLREDAADEESGFGGGLDAAAAPPSHEDYSEEAPAGHAAPKTPGDYAFGQKAPGGLSPAPKASRPLIYKKKRTLDEVLEQTDETFQQMLLRLIQEKGMTNAQAYKKANQDKKLFSKIKSNVNYQPKKNTAVAFAIALELNLDQTRDLLARAGYALSTSNKFDIAIMFFIENQIYDIYKVEEGLFDHHLPLLCNY